MSTPDSADAPRDPAHLAFAKRLNGEVWSLLEKSDRTPEDNERMVHAAHASCYHWLHAGTPVNHQRGEWLIARVYTVLGLGEAALSHAERCVALTGQHPELMADFDRAYALEGLARAQALRGSVQIAEELKQQARAAGEQIADLDDRRLFEGDLTAPGWHGLD